MERISRYLLPALIIASLLISKVSLAQDEPALVDTTEIPETVSIDTTSTDSESEEPAQDEPIAENDSDTQAEIKVGTDLSENEQVATEPTTASDATTIDKTTDSPPLETNKTDPIPATKTVVNTEETKPLAPAASKVTETSTLIDVLELEDHVNNENYQKGYELAQKILSHWEGDPTFDFLYGVHAIETGHYDEATFAFERLTILNPKTLRYRLELARALYFNNNLDTAKTEFEIALASNPPENVKTNIKGFLNKIKKSKEKATHNWAVGAGFNIGYDSNINSGTEEDGVDIPNIGFVSLQEDAQSQGSSFTQINTQGIYSFSHKNHHSLDLSFSTTHKRNDEVTTYDLDVINLSGSYSWQPTRTIRLQGGLTNTDVKLDGAAYQNQNTLNAMALYTRKNGFSFSANISTGSRSAEIESAPDADISLFSLGIIWPSSNTKSTNLSIYSGSDDVSNTELSHYGKDAMGINYGTRLLVSSSIVRSMLISVNSTEYQAPDPNFQEVREDIAVMGSWGYAWNATKFMSLNANLVLSHNNSNLDLFTSYRAILNTGFSVNF